MAKLSRTTFSIIAVSTIILFIFLRLFYLQVWVGEKYLSISEHNFLKEVLVPAPRGEIQDRFGRQIALSKPVVNLYLKLNTREKLEDIKKILRSALNLDDKALNKINVKDSAYLSKRILIKSDLDINQIYQIENALARFSSLELVVDYLRVYPYGQVGAHKIGYLTTNDKRDLLYGSFLANRSGVSGLEKKFDNSLQGGVGSRYFLVDSSGKEVAGLDAEFEKRTSTTQKGKTLSLTIDIELEKLIFDSFGQLNGAAMVHDINTGEILALISKPSFDPNLFSKPISTKDWNQLSKDKSRPFLDRAFLASSPPGSIIKIVTAIAALEENVIDADTKLYCPGYIRIGGRKFRDWLQGGHGTINTKQALVVSSDVFFYQVGLKLGIKKYAKWLDKFQFGYTSDLPFPQNPGVIPSEKFIKKYLNGKWYPGDMANVAIGQGYLTVNVAQASIMTSIVASGGKIPQLSVVKSDKKPVHGNLKISEPTLQIVQEGLLGVINNEKGTGFFARDDGKLAGKTGTAQVISKDARSYGRGKYKNHGWFTAYYPYDNPEIVISVFAEHGSSGGAAGGPIIKKIVKYYKKNYLQEDI